MHNHTVSELTDFTDFVEFERLCADILTGNGYRGIDPQGIQGKDGGKDALHYSDEDDTVFHFSTREDWERKLYEDLEKVNQNDISCTQFVFVSNRKINGEIKDQVKSNIGEKYGWGLDLWDVERLRVELDNHRQKLRKKYLGIPFDRKTHVEETIEFLTEHRDESATTFGSGLGSSKKHVHIFSVPHFRDDHRMKLFDDQYNFQPERGHLKQVLAQGIPGKSSKLQTRVRSDCFSTFFKEQPQNNGYLTSVDIFQPDPIIHEINIFDSGVLECQYDIRYLDLSKERLALFLSLFHDVFRQIYQDLLRDDEEITLVCQILNAGNIDFEKDDGSIHSGEKWLFRETEKGSYEDLISEWDQFVGRTKNKAHHFFNEDPYLA